MFTHTNNASIEGAIQIGAEVKTVGSIVIVENTEGFSNEESRKVYFEGIAE